MIENHDLEVVVFDVLGTLVDEPTGRRTAIQEALSSQSSSAESSSAESSSAESSGAESVDELFTVWERHLELEQRRIAQGQRAYADSEVLDREAAQRVADRAGLTESAVIARLATAGRRHAPWDDSVAGLERLARHFAVVGLSNSSRTALLRLSAHAGLRWHLALSGEAAGAYKPTPEIYRLAIDTAGCPPDRMLMVAAHAYDLRGAQAQGMRTAYVNRPSGDPPVSSDVFDWHFDTLDDLVTALTP